MMGRIVRVQSDVLLAVVAVCLVVAGSVEAQVPKANTGDWPWWRGPNFNGSAEAG